MGQSGHSEGFGHSGILWTDLNTQTGLVILAGINRWTSLHIQTVRSF